MAQPVSRRMVLRLSIAAAGVASSMGALARAPLVRAQATTTTTSTPSPVPVLSQHVEETSIADLQAMMEARRISAAELVQEYQRRIEAIDRSGPFLNSILQLNKDALTIAQ